jgi:hypothetical protein
MTKTTKGIMNKELSVQTDMIYLKFYFTILRKRRMGPDINFNKYKEM